MKIKIPRIEVPDFWMADVDCVAEYVRRASLRGTLHTFGTSALGDPLQAVEYPCARAAFTMLVIGGTHGHEPGGVAAAMNLIHLRETGQDLAGAVHPELQAQLDRTHLYVVPILNPDGRRVCPATFHAQGLDSCVVYASGLQRNGDLVPYDADSDAPLYYFDPSECLFVGGQFNGAGVAINRRRSPDHSRAVEVASLLEFVQPRGIDGIIDLHACGYNFAFQVRSHEAPYWPLMREWQRRAKALFDSKGRPLGALHGDGDPPTPPPFHFNASLFHRHARLMWMAFEGRQGFLGRSSFMPLPTEYEIVDDYLGAIRIFAELGVEGLVEGANRQVLLANSAKASHVI